MVPQSDPPDPHKVQMTQLGVLTKEKLLDMLRPGALDPEQIAGRRIRWAYSSTRSAEQETKRLSDELKQRHLQLGAVEVLVHHAPWRAEEKT